MLKKLYSVMKTKVICTYYCPFLFPSAEAQLWKARNVKNWPSANLSPVQQSKSCHFALALL